MIAYYSQQINQGYMLCILRYLEYFMPFRPDKRKKIEEKRYAFLKITVFNAWMLKGCQKKITNTIIRQILCLPKIYSRRATKLAVNTFLTKVKRN